MNPRFWIEPAEGILGVTITLFYILLYYTIVQGFLVEPSMGFKPFTNGSGYTPLCWGVARTENVPSGTFIKGSVGTINYSLLWGQAEEPSWL